MVIGRCCWHTCAAADRYDVRHLISSTGSCCKCCLYRAICRQLMFFFFFFFVVCVCFFFFFKQKTAYEIHQWLEFRRVLFRSFYKSTLGLLIVLDRKINVNNAGKVVLCLYLCLWPLQSWKLKLAEVEKEEPRRRTGWEKIGEIGRASCRERV